MIVFEAIPSMGQFLLNDKPFLPTSGAETLDAEDTVYRVRMLPGSRLRPVLNRVRVLLNEEAQHVDQKPFFGCDRVCDCLAGVARSNVDGLWVPYTVALPVAIKEDMSADDDHDADRVRCYREIQAAICPQASLLF